MTTAATRRRELLDEVTVGPRLEVRLLDGLALPPHADLLDVGAGDGRLLTRLRMRGHTGRLVGLDLHEVALPTVEWVVGRGEELPFPAQTFDAVGFFQSLFHLQEPDRAVREAARVLRPGGVVFATSHSSGHLSEFWRVVREGVGELPAWHSALQPHGPTLQERLVRLLEANELAVQAEFVGVDLHLTPENALALLDTYCGSLGLSRQAWVLGRKAALARFRALGALQDHAELVLCRATVRP